MRQNHWSEIRGSIRSPERSENGTEWTYSSSPLSTPSSLQGLDHFDLGFGDGHAFESFAGHRGHAAVLADHRDLFQAVRRPISKSLTSWPGVIFRAPVPNSMST